MNCFRRVQGAKALDKNNFACDFTADEKLQAMLKGFHKTVKMLPFESDRDMKHIRLLYPAWTARELGVNQNIKSNLSRLHMLSKCPQNFVTCLVRGDICFILGFEVPEGEAKPDEKEADVIEVYMLSGKRLKDIWSHRFADVFSYWLGCLAKTFPEYFIIASCCQNVDVYNKFTESFGFNFWQEYTYNINKYNLYIFKERI